MVDSHEALGAQATDPLPQDVVLVTDASAEGELVASALRARGFSVRDTSLAELEAQVSEQEPRVVLIDLDQAGAHEVALRIAAIEGLAKPLVLGLGDPGEAPLGATFPRPVDINAVLVEVSAMLGPSAQEPRFSVPPSSAGASHETMPPSAADSDLPLPLEMTARSDAPDVDAMLPGIEEDDDPVGGSRVLPARLSPELERLLASAEQRVIAQGSPSSSLPPEEDVSVLLSEDMLAGLDEPLELEDDDQGTGSGHVKTPGSLGHREEDEQAGGELEAGQADGDGDAPYAAERAEEPPETPREAMGERGPPPTWSQPPRPTTATIPGSGGATNVGALHFPTPSERLVIRDVAAPFRQTIESAVEPARERFEPARERFEPRQETEPPPAVYAEGGVIALLAHAVATRTSGSLALGADGDTRRILLHDGDIVTAASTREDETLVAFLVARGDLPRSLTGPLSRVPFSGRHAGAALIANGHLSQDGLWPVLRAHAEWILGRAACEPEGTCTVEDEPPGRLKLEPSVFGGATGAEVLVETVRRVVPAGVALARIGGPKAKLVEGARIGLLGECALPGDEEAQIRAAQGRSVDEIITRRDPEMVNVLYALVELEVLDAIAPAAPAVEAPKGGADPLDEEALRARVAARLALVMDGDYFELLGVSRGATSYEIRRAYVELRRSFEPGRLLSAQTADLHDDARLILEVLDEAYEILREPHKRDRYRTAIEAGPPEE